MPQAVVLWFSPGRILVHLSRGGAEVQIFAPDVRQMHVVDHTKGQPSESESRCAGGWELRRTSCPRHSWQPESACPEEPLRPSQAVPGALAVLSIPHFPCFLGEWQHQLPPLVTPVLMPAFPHPLKPAPAPQA